MSSLAQAGLQQEAEKKLLESIQAECRKLVDIMRTAKPADAERLKTRLDDIIKATQKLPLEFKRRILSDARNCESMANMRAADTALQAAMGCARHDDATERNRLVGDARGFANKAIALGADSTFRAAVNRKIEIIMMTGRVEHKGPTAAKPLDAAPKPHSAKE